MVMFTMEIGLMIKLMDMEIISIKKVLQIKKSVFKTNKREIPRKNGQMAHILKVIT